MKRSMHNCYVQASMPKPSISPTRSSVIRFTPSLNSARRIRLHRRIAEAMERTWGEKASEHAAEVAYQFWRGAEASGAERGADYAIAAAKMPRPPTRMTRGRVFRIALELSRANDPRRPRLLARLGLALDLDSQSGRGGQD